LILDSSAVVAVLLRETGHRQLAEKMDGADILAMGAPTLLETGMVMIGAFDLHGRALVARFLEEREVVVIPFGERHGSVASEAFIRYGKGRHPAALNYGDCMTYATVSLADEPLLFVGDDFARTDLTPALA
jgi:ribonuclease VapC